jgi:hypothetical protein
MNIRTAAAFAALLVLGACTEIAARPQVDLAREMPPDIALNYIRSYKHLSDRDVTNTMKTYGCRYSDASITLNKGRTVKYQDVLFAPGMTMAIADYYSIYVVMPGGLEDGWCMVTMLPKNDPAKLQSELNDLATAFNALGTKPKPVQP